MKKFSKSIHWFRLRVLHLHNKIHIWKYPTTFLM